MSVRLALLIALLSSPLMGIDPIVGAADSPTSRPTGKQLDVYINALTKRLFSLSDGTNWDARDNLFKNPNAMSSLQESGNTAIALYSLLVSGTPYTDRRLARAEQAVAGLNERIGTYTVGARLMALQLLPQSEQNLHAIAYDAKLLYAQANSPSASGLGFFGYVLTDPDPPANDPRQKGNARTVTSASNSQRYRDLSCSQFGIAGLKFCSHDGFEVPARSWDKYAEGWRASQHEDGGFDYTGVQKQKKSSSGVTVGGVETLCTIRDGVDTRTDDAVPLPPVPAIEEGKAWIADNLGKPRRGTLGGPAYDWFFTARLATDQGWRRINDLDWMQLGTSILSKENLNSASDVSMALGFMGLCRMPLAFNKWHPQPPLDAHDKPLGPDDWNQRLRDVANLTFWTERQLTTPLGWATLDPLEPIEDYLEAPILFMGTSNTFETSDEVEDKLRQYVLRGGLIVGNANGKDRKLSYSFYHLGEALFPNYAWRQLEDTHALLNEQPQLAAWDKKLPPAISAIGNGAREFMILLPEHEDPGFFWQRLPALRAKGMELDGNTRPFQLGMDCFLYATEGGNPLKRGDTLDIPVDPTVKHSRTILVGRAKYSGNWNPEPYAWPRMATWVNNLAGVTLKVSDVPLSPDAIDPDVDAMHLTGTSAFTLTDAERSALKQFCESGKLLIIDGCGGNPEFADSVRQELQTIFGEKSKIVPVTHRMLDGFKRIGQPIQYRATAQKKLKAGLNLPRLEMIEQKGQVRVVFSPIDLTLGMTGQHVDGVIGYTPNTARGLMASILASTPEAK